MFTVKSMHVWKFVAAMVEKTEITKKFMMIGQMWTVHYTIIQFSWPKSEKPLKFCIFLLIEI